MRLRQADASWLAAFPVNRIMTQQDLDNTIDARKRQIELHDTTNKWLAYLVSAAFFVLILLVIVWPSPAEGPAKDILFTLLGVVATGWANIIGFYFGSSAGSQQKSFALSAALNRSIQQGGSG